MPIIIPPPPRFSSVPDILTTDIDKWLYYCIALYYIQQVFQLRFFCFCEKNLNFWALKKKTVFNK